MFKRVLIVFLFLFGIITGCKKDSTTPTNGVLNVAVNFTIDIYGGGYSGLLTSLGWVAVQAGYNNNGVLLYCQSPGNYLAFDMSCPYDCQTNAKAIIQVQPGNITAKCPVCGTTYNLFNGTITKGPGTIALKQYYTSYSDPNLTVSSSPL